MVDDFQHGGSCSEGVQAKQSSISPREAQSHGGDLTKKLEGTILAGMLAFCAAGPALAHSTIASHGHTDSGWSGQITVWGGSQLDVGWSGAVSFGVPQPYAPVYLPVRVKPVVGHHHDYGCRHGRGRRPSHACCAVYTDHHRHGRWKKHGRGHRH
jgi:hypothetical protein